MTTYDAIARGDLRAVPIIGPSGAVATWAIRAEDARAWVPRAYPRAESKDRS